MQMTAKTAFGTVLEASASLRERRLRDAILIFRKIGGSYETALAMLGAAYTKGSGGHHAHAEPAEVISPAASRPHDDAALIQAADKATAAVPASSPPRSAGRTSFACMAILDAPGAATSPGHARRGLAAIGAVQGAVARSLFDSTVLPDGRKLREVRWAECPALARRYRTLSRVLTAVHGHATPPDPSATLDTIVNEARLAEIIHAAEMANDLH